MIFPRMKQQRCKRNKRAFTLVEALLAIGIVGMLLGIFMTLFVPVKSMLTAALAREESGRIINALQTEMENIRPDERAPASTKNSSYGKYVTPFDKAFYWFRNSQKPSTSIAIFSYRADISKRRRADGSYPPVPRNGKVLPANTELVTMAAPLNSKLHRNSIRQAVGPVFIVRMTELREEKRGEFKLAPRPGILEKGSTPNSYVSDDEDNPWGGAVYYRADFYRLFPADPARYTTKSWNDFNQPIFSTNLSFRR